MKPFKYLLLLFILFNIPSYTQDDADSSKIIIDKWLKAGPIQVQMPAAADTGKNIKEKELLGFSEIDIEKLYPGEGDKLKWGKGREYSWERIPYNVVGLKSSDKLLPEITYLVSYIDNDRWIKAKLELKSCQLFKAYIDGKEILSKTSTQAVKGDSACKPEKASKDIELERGKHILVVKALKDPKADSDWSLTASLKIDSMYSKENIITSTDQTNYATVEKLLEDPKIGDISISADGELAAVSVSYIPFGEDEKKSWIDIYKTSDGSLYKSFKGGLSLSSIGWAPSGKKLTYTSTDKKTTLWYIDLENGTSEALLENIKDFGGYSWSPDESYIIYSVTEKASEDKSGLKLVEGMNERLPGSGDMSYLYKISLPEKIKTRLTAGGKTLYLSSISNDGKKILLSDLTYDWKQRPYSYSVFYILDLTSMKMDTIISLSWAASASFSPDGKKILFIGGPSLFGNIGVNVKEGTLPNDYDTQAFIYEISNGKVEAITKEFDPEIGSAYWSNNENTIYFNTTDRSFQHVYRYDLNTKKFTLIKLDVDIVSDIEYANNKPEAVYKGSGATVPDKFYYVDLKSGKSKLLYNPAKESFEHIALGKTETWTFKNSRGEDIDGLIYFPPGFDKNKKYPVIVNYYGGTSPTDQSFEGRYPKNIWAANGYIVYVLQPSGATGYGQQFSAYHVNDWGEITAQEIIEGTKKFLQEHPYADPKRIGCIGASYGGFMTLNILTKTDIFTAAVSHAGISNLADYWGVGYWGYSYSAVATANSFPWNRKDIYIDRSPLFSADKINTPLLLLHGSSDTNVPPGESTQMFTALKLLGKDVEYIQVAGQDHHILEYNKRKQWTKTIIAYFDKYLKGQPEWWNSLYSKDEK